MIDNACTDATAEVAARHGVRRLALTERCSYAAAINRGLAAAGADATATDAVLLLNADCFLRPGFLAAALPHLAAPGVGSVAPRLLRAERVPGARTRRRPPRSMPRHGRSTAGARTAWSATAGPLAEHTRPAAGFRRRRGGRPVPPRGARRLPAGRARGAGRGHGAVGVGRGSGLAGAAAGLGLRVRARRGQPTTCAPTARRRGHRWRRPTGGLQFRNRLLMVAKNETGLGSCATGRGFSATRSSRSATPCCASASLLGGYRDAWALRAGVRRRRRVIHARRRALAPGRTAAVRSAPTRPERQRSVTWGQSAGAAGPSAAARRRGASRASRYTAHVPRAASSHVHAGAGGAGRRKRLGRAHQRRPDHRPR